VRGKRGLWVGGHEIGAWWWLRLGREIVARARGHDAVVLVEDVVVAVRVRSRVRWGRPWGYVGGRLQGSSRGRWISRRGAGVWIDVGGLEPIVR
jgi:hypothetical protein